jgi:hypothetical protein
MTSPTASGATAPAAPSPAKPARPTAAPPGRPPPSATGTRSAARATVPLAATPASNGRCGTLSAGRGGSDYAVLNEIYSIGWVLSYIFIGREALNAGTGDVNRIVQKCTANDAAQRYQKVIDLIADVERLPVSPTDTPA